MVEYSLLIIYNPTPPYAGVRKINPHCYLPNSSIGLKKT